MDGTAAHPLLADTDCHEASPNDDRLDFGTLRSACVPVCIANAAVDLA